MQEFKVGDKVKYHSPHSEEYVIIHINGEDAWINLDTEEVFRGGHISNLKYLEHVPFFEVGKLYRSDADYVYHCLHVYTFTGVAVLAYMDRHLNYVASIRVKAKESRKYTEVTLNDS